MSMDLNKGAMLMPEHAVRAVHTLFLVKESSAFIVLEPDTIVDNGGSSELFLTVGKLASVLVIALG